MPLTKRYAATLTGFASARRQRASLLSRRHKRSASKYVSSTLEPGLSMLGATQVEYLGSLNIAVTRERKRQILADILVWAEVTQQHYDSKTRRYASNSLDTNAGVSLDTQTCQVRVSSHGKVADGFVHNVRGCGRMWHTMDAACSCPHALCSAVLFSSPISTTSLSFVSATS